MNRPSFTVVAAAVLALGLGSVQAAGTPASGGPSVVGLLGGAPLSNVALANHRGGHALQVDIANLRAKLDQNKALDNITGDNYVGQNAFTNSNGFDTVVQNSGNNVIIQNSTIVNLQMQ